MRMARYWMTESLAIVMMAAEWARLRKSTPNNNTRTLSRTSRYSVKTTAGRIQQAAQDSGLSVFASMEGVNSHPNLAEQILVLADANGSTPVIQDEGGAHSDFGLPLEVRIAEQEDGTSLVTIIDATSLEDDHQALPKDVVRSVSQLPRLIEAALG